MTLPGRTSLTLAVVSMGSPSPWPLSQDASTRGPPPRSPGLLAYPRLPAHCRPWASPISVCPTPPLQATWLGCPRWGGLRTVGVAPGRLSLPPACFHLCSVGPKGRGSCRGREARRGGFVDRRCLHLRKVNGLGKPGAAPAVWAWARAGRWCLRGFCGARGRRQGPRAEEGPTWSPKPRGIRYHGGDCCASKRNQ